MSAILDIWHLILNLVTQADPITIAIVVVIVLAAGFAMQSLGSIVTATFLALIVFSITGYLRAVIAGKDLYGFAAAGWHEIATLPVALLIGYAIIFAVLSAIVHIVRSLVLR